MDKQKADGIITEYLPKIYGFAVKKSFTYEEAEELSSDIVAEVYTSLIKSDEVYNVDGYVWRISEHVYARYVSHKKLREGISIDGIQIPDLPEEDSDEETEQIERLRLSVAYLSRTRRDIVYSFYYRNKSISQISKETGIPEGTVKWHLSKARKELLEEFSMERKVGKLGIKPIKHCGMGHNGSPGKHGRATEYYLGDTLSLNIVYSVYHTPRTREGIADELGVAPAFIEEKIDFLEANGYLVKQSGGRYTTYVRFTPETYSLEQSEVLLKKKLEVARTLVDAYVPVIKQAVSEIDNAYIPSGNVQLLEMAAIMYCVSNKCRIKTDIDTSKYFIKTLDGGNYQAFIYLPQEQSDPEYKRTLELPDYWVCGSMNRWSEKYPVESWSMDSRYSSREGAWKNNFTSDYEYVYEYMLGDIGKGKADEDKLKRLRKRGFITEDGKVNVLVVKGKQKEFFDALPKPDKSIVDSVAAFALEQATLDAKDYPPQMRDLVIANNTSDFIGTTVALMALDILTERGELSVLSEDEKVTANLIMFCDRLPE